MLRQSCERLVLLLPLVPGVHVEKPLLQYQYQLRGRASFEACTAKAHLRSTSTWVIRPVPSSGSSQVGSDGRKAGTDATALSPSLSLRIWLSLAFSHRLRRKTRRAPTTFLLLSTQTCVSLKNVFSLSEHLVHEDLVDRRDLIRLHSQDHHTVKA